MTTKHFLTWNLNTGATKETDIASSEEEEKPYSILLGKILQNIMDLFFINHGYAENLCQKFALQIPVYGSNHLNIIVAPQSSSQGLRYQFAQGDFTNH